MSNEGGVKELKLTEPLLGAGHSEHVVMLTHCMLTTTLRGPYHNPILQLTELKPTVSAKWQNKSPRQYGSQPWSLRCLPLPRLGEVLLGMGERKVEVKSCDEKTRSPAKGTARAEARRSESQVIRSLWFLTLAALVPCSPP